MSGGGLPIGRILVVGVFLLTAACSSQRPRPDEASTARETTPPPTTTIQEPAELAPREPVALIPLSPWQRLRPRFALPACEYSEAVRQEARRYTRSANLFSASWQRSMPLLLLVIDEIERRDLPGEFALLPYVESGYQPLPATGKGPAGIWQLMGRTATARGLQVGHHYDQRLDALASTDVALDLIERYDREFGDWRIATMAFNAGEFRLKRALHGKSAADLDAHELARLKLTATTHQHLARMLALSCIISDPQRFGVSLPDAEPGDELRLVVPPSPIDLRLAAALAELPLDEVLRFNPAWRGQARPSGPAARVLLPAHSIERFNAALSKFPPAMLTDWRTQQIEQTRALSDLSAELDVPIDLIAAANQLEPGTNVEYGVRLLLPGAGLGSEAPEQPGVHIVERGDTLSGIARHYQIGLASLLRWNHLTSRSVLRIGARLRLHAP